MHYLCGHSDYHLNIHDTLSHHHSSEPTQSPNDKVTSTIYSTLQFTSVNNDLNNTLPPYQPPSKTIITIFITLLYFFLIQIQYQRIISLLNITKQLNHNLTQTHLLLNKHSPSTVTSKIIYYLVTRLSATMIQYHVLSFSISMYWKCSPIYDYMYSNNVDIVCMSETNTHWKNKQYINTFKRIVRKLWPRIKLSTSESKYL